MTKLLIFLVVVATSCKGKESDKPSPSSSPVEGQVPTSPRAPDAAVASPPVAVAESVEAKPAATPPGALLARIKKANAEAIASESWEMPARTWKSPAGSDLGKAAAQMTKIEAEVKKCFDSAQGDREWVRCEMEGADAYTALLDSEQKELLAAHPEKAQGKVKASQAAWVKERDAVFDKIDVAFKDSGSEGAASAAALKKDVIRDRVEELHQTREWIGSATLGLDGKCCCEIPDNEKASGEKLPEACGQAGGTCDNIDICFD